MCAGQELTNSQLGTGRQSWVERHVSAVVTSPISHPQPACTHIQTNQYSSPLKHAAAQISKHKRYRISIQRKAVWIVGHACAYEIHTNM